MSDEQHILLQAFAGKASSVATDINIFSSSGEIIAVVKKADDAKRIVSCVNACAGINPEAVPELLEACRMAFNVSLPNAVAKAVEKALAKAKSK